MSDLFAPFKKGVSPTLITITAAGQTPIRLTDNSVDLIYNGYTYKAYEFKAIRPEQGVDSSGVASLIISSVDQSLIKLIRIIDPRNPPIISMDAVYLENFDSEPVYSVLEGYNFIIKRATWDAKKITLSLGISHILADQFPAGTFSPWNNQGGVL